MSFPKSFLDELKNRIRVSDVVGRKVKLTRRGREFVGLSPFNNEKTPSFTVNDDKQFYHCFSTGEHGDAIKFLEKTENLSFLEAVERLASEAGMEMPQRDQRQAEQEQKRTGLIDVMAAAQDYFRESLNRGKGAEARAYLARRGLSDATIEDFGIGFAPDDRSGLKSYMMGRGFKIPQMVEGGLLISGEDIREPYDRFRNRVMFPIEDARGRVIAFGGRALDPRAKAKYMNSPETPLFHKGRLLYNLARARKPSYDQSSVIAVEGYMDVVALGQAGIHNVVAPLGTALTEEQVELLWRLAPEPTLCFDGDKAGLRAAYRAVERVLPLLKPGHSLRFAIMPPGKDPDDLVKEQGRFALDEVISAASPLHEMLAASVLKDERLKTPDDRARLEAKLEKSLSAIANEPVKRHYQQTLRARLREHFASVFGWKTWGGQGGGTRKPSAVKQSYLKPPRVPGANQEISILVWLFRFPELVEVYDEVTLSLKFGEEMRWNIAREFLQYMRDAPDGADFGGFREHIGGRGLDGEMQDIVRHPEFKIAAQTDDVSDAEEAITRSFEYLAGLGQFAEILEDSRTVDTEKADDFHAFCARTSWFFKSLQNSPISGADGHLIEFTAEFKAKRRAAGRRAEPYRDDDLIRRTA
jgi:DNA primase catalytic core